jgi:hypothetical protein
MSHADAAKSVANFNTFNHHLPSRSQKFELKFVPSLSWSEVVTKMAYVPDETNTRAIYCQQICAAVTAVIVVS